jgi:hypothetical protein
MKRYLFYIIVLNLSLSSIFPGSRYYTIERQLYRKLEYQFIMADKVSIFIMNQPYTETQLSNENRQDDPSYFRSSYRANKIDSDEGISVLIKPGWQIQRNSKISSNPSAYIDGYFKIDNVIGVNRLFASKQLTMDPDFHGDKAEWMSAYMYDAYVIYSPSSKLSFFGGRTARNYGIPNEYSLFLSDNPFPYDHYGFSTGNMKFQFSWYFSRLNNMEGFDDEGVVIPLGETQNVNRYLAFQRLDWRINSHFQLGISEATLYGGPNESFVAAYLNPLNFYYLSQRNQLVQMNGSWQFNLFYYVPKQWAYYLDFYIDDFIVNNEEEFKDRDVHPDRLAIMSKFSVPDILVPQTLSTLRYVRIWNETYVTYRNFENWVYFNKGIGFPERSYEGVKLESSYFGSDNLQISLSLEAWRKGDRSLFSTLIDEANMPFPAGPVSQGLSSLGNIQYIKKQLDLEINMIYEIIESESNSISSNIGLNFGFNYRFYLGVPG